MGDETPDYEAAFKELAAHFYIGCEGRIEYSYIEGTDIAEHVSDETAILLKEHVSGS